MVGGGQTEEKPSEFQIKILEKIVDDEIRTISFRKPYIQLASAMGGKSLDETMDALRDLENQGVLSLMPRKAFLFFDRSAYMVYFNKVKALHDSYQQEEKDQADYEKAIICAITQDEIEIIGLDDPHAQLREISEGRSLDETLKALEGLEEKTVLKRVCANKYRVDITKATDLYYDNIENP